ncbi:MAG: DUF1189 domain-containing protein [Alphaproteobacteria bacterium]|nr:DUF1189 domain-containing protein [Alphaproteobacteria bacterium]
MNFFKCFYSPDFYAALIRKGKGIGISFILMIALIDFIGVMVMLARLVPDLNNHMTNITAQLPALSINEGVLKMEKPSPYYIQIDGKNIVMFDTSGPSKELANVSKILGENKIQMLVTSEFVAMQKSNAALEIYRFDDTKFKNITITQDKWIEVGQQIGVWVVPVAFAVMAFAFILIAFVATFIKALIVRLMAIFLRNPPDFSAAMRLAAAAAIPAVTLVTLYNLVNDGITQNVPGALQAAQRDLPAYSSFVLWFLFAAVGLWSSNRTSNAEHDRI